MRLQPESYKLKKNYKFGDTLGVGSFGQVKQATWTTHDPPIEVAIKVILKKSVKGKEHVVYEFVSTPSNSGGTTTEALESARWTS